MGGKTEYLQAPTAPSAPTQTATLSEYIQNYPQLVALEKQYSPELAQLERSIQQNLYPQQAGLGEQLAGVASQGIGSSAPDWYKNQMQDVISSRYGRNQVFNPLGQQAYGADYQSGLQNWQKYYTDLSLSLNNKMPIVQGQQNAVQNYTPQTALNYATNNFGTQAGIYGQQSQNYWNQQNYSPPWMNMLGTIGGGLAQGAGMGMGYGMMK